MTIDVRVFDILDRIRELWERAERTPVGSLEYLSALAEIRALSEEHQWIVNEARKLTFPVVSA